MTPKLYTFDIETGPQPIAGLLSTFEPKFDPDARLKDPDKVAASIAEKRVDWEEKSALYAERGELLAFGFSTGDDGGVTLDRHFYGEAEVLRIVIDSIRSHADGGYIIAGFNILGFDLPFIRRRCLLHGIPVPFYNRTDKWKPWGFPVYDPMVDWQCGNHRDTYVNLDTLARAFGVGKKTASGADFAKLYATDRDAALAYLREDVRLTAAVCRKMLENQ